MKRNMSTLDRSLRIVCAALVGIFYAMGLLTGTAATILGILALIFVLTSLIGTCPLYRLLKIGTLSKKNTSKK